MTVVADRILNGLVVDGCRQSVDESADEFDAWVLRLEEPERILSHAFTVVSIGWLRALEALGDNPLGCPQAYFKLQNIFANPTQARMAEALAGLATISEETLRVGGALDQRWLCAETLTRITSAAKAEAFNFAAAFAEAMNSRATDEVILGRLAELGPNETLDEMLLKFVHEADEFPDMPVGDATDVERLAVLTGGELNEMAPARRMVVVIRSPDEGRAADAW